MESNEGGKKKIRKIKYFRDVLWILDFRYNIINYIIFKMYRVLIIVCEFFLVIFRIFNLFY